MVLPVTPVNVAAAYEQIRGQALNTMNYFSNLHGVISGGEGVDAQYFLAGITSALATLGMAQRLAADDAIGPALDAYVQQQTGDDTLNVHAELTASMAALQTAAGTMIAVYPKDASGHLLDRIFNPDGSVASVVLSSASVASADTAMTAWLSTVI